MLRNQKMSKYHIFGAELNWNSFIFTLIINFFVNTVLTSLYFWPCICMYVSTECSRPYFKNLWRMWRTLIGFTFAQKNRVSVIIIKTGYLTPRQRKIFLHKFCSNEDIVLKFWIVQYCFMWKRASNGSAGFW